MRDALYAWANPNYATTASWRKLGGLVGAGAAVFTGIGLLVNVSGMIWFGVGLIVAWAFLFGPLFLARVGRGE